MSLLLEALKKAELAKQGAGGAAALDFEPAAAPAQAAPKVTTRENLPDISQPVSIEFASNSRPVRDSVALSTADAQPEQETRAEPFRAAEPPPYEAAMPDVAVPVSPDRAAARQLFEAKEMDYNPKRPFYITLGVLSLSALGYGGYLWWQLQPRSMYSAKAVAAQKAEPAAAPQVARVPAPVQSPNAQIPVPVSSDAPVQIAGAQLQSAGSPQSAPSQPATAAGIPPVTRTQPDRAASAPSSSSTALQESPPPIRPRAAASARLTPPIAITPPTTAVDPVLERAYAAYMTGDLPAARDQYQVVLQRDANNRDALLGLAAIDARTNNNETAELRYLRLIELDPRDSLAQAGLLAIRGQLDPVQAESRIKSMIASDPDSVHLYFTLGNQYARQERWPEAQQAYFRVYGAEPENPDYAFNLAVALDHLRQPKLALQYYQRAIALSSGRNAGFDKARADIRIQELQR